LKTSFLALAMLASRATAVKAIFMAMDAFLKIIMI